MYRKKEKKKEQKTNKTTLKYYCKADFIRFKVTTNRT